MLVLGVVIPTRPLCRTRSPATGAGHAALTLMFLDSSEHLSPWHGALLCHAVHLPLFFLVVKPQPLAVCAISLLQTSIASLLGAGLSVFVIGYVKSYR